MLYFRASVFCFPVFTDFYFSKHKIPLVMEPEKVYYKKQIIKLKEETEHDFDGCKIEPCLWLR